jgi:hypothetical protein
VRGLHQEKPEVLIHFWMISRELRIDSGSTQTRYFLSIPLKRLFYEADFIEAIVVDADCVNAGHYKEDEKAPTGEAAYDIPHAYAPLNCIYQIQHPISELELRQSSDQSVGWAKALLRRAHHFLNRKPAR